MKNRSSSSTVGSSRYPRFDRVSNYQSIWAEDRRRWNDDTLDVSPHNTCIRRNQAVQFSTNLGPSVYWSVEGGPVNGTITPSGRFSPSSTLVKDDYVTLTARTGDGRQVAHAFVALQPLILPTCPLCGVSLP